MHRAGRRSWRVLAGLAAVIVVGALLLDVRVEIGRTPAAAEGPQVDRSPPLVATPERAADPAFGTSAPETRAFPQAAEALRTFSWAPVPGAAAYRVELFSGASRVFAADVRHPKLTLPGRWEYAGEQRALESGEYRWYVWAVTGGRRASGAVVQAQLVVP